MSSFKTIEHPTESEPLKIKKSKFIGFAFPVKNENEVKHYLGQLKDKHSSASHWCYAYTIGTKSPTERVNDDGEPSNSAGKPILGQIKAFKLTNILLVVVRYYGGTKLGVGGLISAYKDSAKLVLSNSKIIEKELTTRIHLNFKYDLLNSVMRIVKQFQLEITEQRMEMDCSLILTIPLRTFSEVMENLDRIYGLQVRVL